MKKKQNKTKTETKTKKKTKTKTKWGSTSAIRSHNIARVLALHKSYWAAMNQIFIYARPCVNKYFFHYDVFSCVFRLFILSISTQKSRLWWTNFLAFLELKFWPLKPTAKVVRCFANNRAWMIRWKVCRRYGHSSGKRPQIVQCREISNLHSGLRF